MGLGPLSVALGQLAEQIHPTRERIAKAVDYDRGDPFNTSQEHRRSARLVTPWDLYAKPLNEGKAVLEPHQIQAGNQYATDYTKAGYGRIGAHSYEPAVDNCRHNEPSWVWDARDKISQAQRSLRAYEIELLAWVLFQGKAAKEWAKFSGRHARGGLDYLRDALDTIAPVWHLAPRRKA